jgi:Domain of unknown function (DUF3846)
MRAIVIDPAARTVEEIDTDGSLASLQEVVGGCIEYVAVHDNHHCYVNEEGLLEQPEHFFMFDGGHQPLAGRGIILSSTPEGDEAPCGLPLDWVSQRVSFMDREAVRVWASDHHEPQLQPEPGNGPDHPEYVEGLDLEV